MKIANADKLIHHFENVVDVKLFTVPEIVTIVKSFSVEIPEGTEFIMPREKAQEWLCPTCTFYDSVSGSEYCSTAGDFTAGVTKCKCYMAL